MESGGLGVVVRQWWSRIRGGGLEVAVLYCKSFIFRYAEFLLNQNLRIF